MLIKICIKKCAYWARIGLGTLCNKLGVVPGWPAGNDGAADGMFDGMFAREPPGEAAGGGLPGQEDLTEQDDFGLREGVASDGHRNRRCASAGRRSPVACPVCMQGFGNFCSGQAGCCECLTALEGVPSVIYGGGLGLT